MFNTEHEQNCCVYMLGRQWQGDGLEPTGRASAQQPWHLLLQSVLPLVVNDLICLHIKIQNVQYFNTKVLVHSCFCKYPAAYPERFFPCLTSR